MDCCCSLGHQTWLPVWGHPELLARSDEWFVQRLRNATSHTQHQGYRGARWGKMLGEANMWAFGQGDGSKRIMCAYAPLALGCSNRPVFAFADTCACGSDWESPNNIVRQFLF